MRFEQTNFSIGLFYQSVHISRSYVTFVQTRAFYAQVLEKSYQSKQTRLLSAYERVRRVSLVSRNTLENQTPCHKLHMLYYVFRVNDLCISRMTNLCVTRCVSIIRLLVVVLIIGDFLMKKIEQQVVTRKNRRLHTCTLKILCLPTFLYSDHVLKVSTSLSQFLQSLSLNSTKQN